MIKNLLKQMAKDKDSMFTQIRVGLLDHDIVKANVSCKVADTIYLTGMRVMYGRHGRYVSMPAKKDTKGEFHDVFFPTSKEVRDTLIALVLAEYDKQVAQS